jgi:hypothetical protein
MRNSTLVFVTAVVACLAAVGCRETTSSQNIKTRGIVALMDVTASSESSSRVVVTLKVGGPASNTYVDLEGGDKLFAVADGEEKEMVAEDAGRYEADFDTGAEDTEFTVKLEREWDVPARNSSGTLPAPFDITTDFGSTPLSREDDDLVVTWEPGDSGDDMRLELEDSGPSCIFDDDFDIAGDSGEHTIPAGEISSTDADDPGECDVTLILIRRRNGQADANFDPDSRFRLEQVRKTDFVSAP